MGKNRTKNLLKMNDLAKALSIRSSTIKYYSEVGILPFEQKGSRLAKRFDKEITNKRLKEIQRLKKQGLSIEDIVKCLKV